MLVVLARADIGLWSDPVGTRVTLPHTQALVTATRRERAFVRFEGDQRPTGFAGEGKADTVQLTSRFVSGEHATLLDLLDLFDTADDDADGRLLLRTHLGEVAGLDPLMAVLVTDVQRTALRAGTVDLAWGVQAVEFDLES